MIGLSAFSVLITLALAMTTLAPLVLITLLIFDWKKGDLW